MLLDLRSTLHCRLIFDHELLPIQVFGLLALRFPLWNPKGLLPVELLSHLVLPVKLLYLVALALLGLCNHIAGRRPLPLDRFIVHLVVNCIWDGVGMH